MKYTLNTASNTSATKFVYVVLLLRRNLHCTVSLSLQLQQNVTKNEGQDNRSHDLEREAGNQFATDAVIKCYITSKVAKTQSCTGFDGRLFSTTVLVRGAVAHPYLQRDGRIRQSK